MSRKKTLIIIVLFSLLAAMVFIFRKPVYRLTKKDYSNFPYLGITHISFQSSDGDTIALGLQHDKLLTSYYKPKGFIRSGTVETRKVLFNESEPDKKGEILFNLKYSPKKKLILEIGVFELTNRYFYQWLEFESLKSKKDTSIESGGYKYTDVKVIENNSVYFVEPGHKLKKYFNKIYWSLKSGIVLLEADNGFKLALLI